jgi:hypothetical protein
MSNSDKRVRDLPHAEYVAARRKAARDEPRTELPPSERPLPSDATMMTPEQYAAAKRKVTRS